MAQVLTADCSIFVRFHCRRQSCYHSRASLTVNLHSSITATFMIDIIIMPYGGYIKYAVR